MRRVLLTILAILATGCAAGAPVEKRFGTYVSPELTHLEGVRRQVSVGEVMTTSQPVFRYDVVVVSDRLEARSSHRGSPVTVHLEPGTYLLEAEDDYGRYFWSSAQLPVQIGDRRRAGVGGLYLPRDEALPSLAYWRWSGSMFNQAIGASSGRCSFYVAPLPQRPAHVVEESVLPWPYVTGFVSTLTYAGVGGGQIKFVYREYSSGLARAAFTQEVALDYKPGQSYAYQDARFTVHAADSSRVEYTLVRPLRLPDHLHEGATQPQE